MSACLKYNRTSIAKEQMCTVLALSILVSNIVTSYFTLPTWVTIIEYNG